MRLIKTPFDKRVSIYPGYPDNSPTEHVIMLASYNREIKDYVRFSYVSPSLDRLIFTNKSTLPLHFYTSSGEP